jgi:hypothetical protein
LIIGLLHEGIQIEQGTPNIDHVLSTRERHVEGLDPILLPYNPHHNPLAILLAQQIVFHHLNGSAISVDMPNAYRPAVGRRRKLSPESLLGPSAGRLVLLKIWPEFFWRAQFPAQSLSNRSNFTAR